LFVLFSVAYTLREKNEEKNTLAYDITLRKKNAGTVPTETNV